MNKKEFIKHLAVAGNLTVPVAEGVYKLFVESLRLAFRDGCIAVNLPELGKFEVKVRKAKNARNFRTGEFFLTSEKKIIAFRPSKKMSELVR